METSILQFKHVVYQLCQKKITQAITINQTLELAKDEPNKPKVKKYDSRVNKKKKETVAIKHLIN